MPAVATPLLLSHSTIALETHEAFAVITKLTTNKCRKKDVVVSAGITMMTMLPSLETKGRAPSVVQTVAVSNMALIGCGGDGNKSNCFVLSSLLQRQNYDNNNNYYYYLLVKFYHHRRGQETVSTKNVVTCKLLETRLAHSTVCFKMQTDFVVT